MAVKDRRTKILLSLFLLSDVSFTPVIIDEKVQTIFDFTFNQKTKTRHYDAFFLNYARGPGFEPG